MLTYEDCVGLTDLEEEDIEAIAQHEHVPEIVAAELGCCLAHQPGGEWIIDKMIREDIDAANRHHLPLEAVRWNKVLRNFETSHHLMRDAA